MQIQATAEHLGTTKNFEKFELKKPFIGTIYVPKGTAPGPIIVNLKK